MSRSRTSYSYTVQKTSRQRSSSFYCFKLPMALTTSSVPKFEAKISKQECAMCTAPADGRAVGADAASRQSLTRQVMSRYRSVYDCVIIHTHTNTRSATCPAREEARVQNLIRFHRHTCKFVENLASTSLITDISHNTFALTCTQLACLLRDTLSPV